MSKKIIFLLTSLAFSFTVFAQIGLQENIIDNSGNIDIPIGVFAADFDGDGDIDLLSGSIGDDKLAWYENTDGQGAFGSPQVITTNADGVQAIFAADLDNDNDIDVVALSHNDDKVTWYENTDGLGAFGPEQLIVGPTMNATVTESINVADIDGDSDMDILVTYYGLNDKISWFENTNGLGDFSVEHIITTAVNSPGSVFTADLDGDDDMDVLSGSTSDGKIAWYENTDGLGTFGPQQIIREQFSLFKVYAADIDGDNDMDIISMAGITFDEIAWYENTDGLGTFGTAQIIATDVDYASSVYATDIDNDNDLDLVSVSQNNDKLVWYENTNGLGAFGTQKIISLNLDGPNSVVAAFIDSDNKIDLATSSQNDDKIAWFKNLGIVTNEINGTISLDVGSNGCTNNGIVANSLLIETTDGNNTLSTFSLENGSYQLFPGEGSFTSQLVQLPSYYTTSPVSQTTNFNGIGNTETINFCIQPTQVINDLNVSVYPSIDEPRPGFNTAYQIVYKNIGTTQLSGNVTFEFDGAKLNFLNASETLASQTSNELTFSFTNINPFETRTIDLEFNVFPPPTTNINDGLITTVTVNPVSGDSTSSDNAFILNQTVIGSYDPNDIRVLEGELITIDDADKYLHYLIRFQNTGTASAINVNVENVLDTKLDWSTLQIETLSHMGRVEITNGNAINFIFDGINLPDSTNDEPNSHGFITYKIKPKSNVVIGDVFSSTADIFFDFNPPITTNTVTTEIVTTLSVQEFETSKISLFPNPTNNFINIKGTKSIDTVKIYDFNGRLLNTIVFTQEKKEQQIEVNNLINGIYFLEVASGDSIQTKKFIKI